jgi:hypothetical protein
MVPTMAGTLRYLLEVIDGCADVTPYSYTVASSPDCASCNHMNAIANDEHRAFQRAIQQRDEARRDGARLDWLQCNAFSFGAFDPENDASVWELYYMNPADIEGPALVSCQSTLRDCIDAARTADAASVAPSATDVLFPGAA